MPTCQRASATGSLATAKWGNAAFVPHRFNLRASFVTGSIGRRDAAHGARVFVVAAKRILYAVVFLLRLFIYFARRNIGAVCCPYRPVFEEAVSVRNVSVHVHFA